MPDYGLLAWQSKDSSDSPVLVVTTLDPGTRSTLTVVQYSLCTRRYHLALWDVLSKAFLRSIWDELLGKYSLQLVANLRVVN